MSFNRNSIYPENSQLSIAIYLQKLTRFFIFLCSIEAFGAIASQTRETHVKDASNQTDYLIRTQLFMNKFHEQLIKNVCNLLLNTTTNAIKYIPIEEWGDQVATLLRGVNQKAQNETEDCLINLMDNEYEHQMPGLIDDELVRKIVIYTLGPLLILTLLTISLSKVHGYCKSRFFDSNSENEDEENIPIVQNRLRNNG